MLEFATLGGARNAGLGDRVGTLTPGKQADIVLVRADGPAHVSGADPITTITSMSHPGLIDTVLVAGHVRKRGGVLTGIDADAAARLIHGSRHHLLAADAPRAQLVGS